MIRSWVENLSDGPKIVHSPVVLHKSRVLDMGSSYLRKNTHTDSLQYIYHTQTHNYTYYNKHNHNTLRSLVLMLTKTFLDVVKTKVSKKVLRVSIISQNPQYPNSRAVEYGDIRIPGFQDIRIANCRPARELALVFFTNRSIGYTLLAG